MLAVAIVAVHAAWRRPRGVPPAVLVAADGSCRVPQWDSEALVLCSHTQLTRLAVDLHLLGGSRSRRLVLLVDQVEREEWVRLAAILRRATVQ